MSITEQNKTVVIRFNKEAVEASAEVFSEIFHKDFINHSAASGVSNGKEGVINTFCGILRPALSEMKIEIYDQVAEGDKVTTRKAICGIHTGLWLGIAPTNKKVKIDVIDIVTIRDGKYFEHWGMNNLQAVLAELKS
jgi:predicted ester cyclase